MNGPQATRNADGKLCVLKEEMVQSVVKEPILKCTLKNVEKCHYTYITQFTPIREEVGTGKGGSRGGRVGAIAPTPYRFFWYRKENRSRKRLRPSKLLDLPPPLL